MSIIGFNPRTRTGCDLNVWYVSMLNFVSTHAPARGATHEVEVEPGVFEFQPTHPHGVRHRVFPARVPYASFNPRTRTGCDLPLPRVMRTLSVFQPTHPHGVRRVSVCPFAGYFAGFNPRTRTGCDSGT